MNRPIAIFLLIFACQPAIGQNFDVNTLKKINPQDSHSGFFKVTSSSVYYVGAGAPTGVLIAGLISGDASLKRKSYEMFGAALIELSVCSALKNVVGRQRPAEKYPKGILPYRDASGQSFPSGHASIAFETAASLSLQFKKWYVVVPSYLWAATVGYSRMYLGVHYPSDVFAGAVVGIGSAYLANWLNHSVINKKRNKPLKQTF